MFQEDEEAGIGQSGPSGSQKSRRDVGTGGDSGRMGEEVHVHKKECQRSASAFVPALAGIPAAD